MKKIASFLMVVVLVVLTFSVVAQAQVPEDWKLIKKIALEYGRKDSQGWITKTWDVEERIRGDLCIVVTECSYFGKDGDGLICARQVFLDIGGAEETYTEKTGVILGSVRNEKGDITSTHKVSKEQGDKFARLIISYLRNQGLIK